MKRLLALLPLASVIVAQKAPEPTLLVTMKGDHGSYVDPENPYQVPTDGKHHASLSTAKSNALPASCPDYTDYVQKTTNPPLSSGPLKLPYQRPSPECRTFNSSVVEKVVSDVYKQMTDPDLAQIFRNTFPNTVDTAISYFNKSTTDPLTFVVTGDIPASWFRDTQRELENYHVLAPQDPNLATLLKGAINFQARAININEYCNSFNAPPGSGVPVSSNGQQDTVFPTYSPADVFECKYEIDSLASFLRLSFQYWNATNDYSFIKANNSAWIKAVENTITLVEDQMIPTFSKNGSLNTPFYTFYRLTTAPTDSLDNQGRGNPVSDQMGALVRSQFRPSDDACTFPYFIPGNAMISVELGHLNTLLSSLPISAQTSTTKKLASHADQLSKMIRKGIEQVGTFDHPTFGKVYAYEVDGYGSRIVMDDANIPSLLSLPYIGYLDRNDTTYQNTRNMVLSREGNPYFFEGYGSGIGGPHVGYEYAWPMSNLVRILTTDNETEIKTALEDLKTTTGGLGVMHESHLVSVPKGNTFSRPWFIWANSLFGQMIVTLAREHPKLVFGPNGKPYYYGASKIVNTTTSAKVHQKRGVHVHHSSHGKGMLGMF